jgi:hypothetical protein
MQGWEGERTNVSPRDIQRLPLARMMAAALAAAAAAERPADVPRLPSGAQPGRGQIAFDPGDNPRWAESGPLWAREARRVLIPKGRPQRGKSARFYSEIAKAHRELAAAGVNPVKEIAQRKKVPENTVHQWIHRARRLGLLEPSPRSKSKEDESD